MWIGHKLFSFPSDFIIFQGVGGWNTFTVHDHKLLIQNNTDIHIIQPMFPFLIDLILEGELNVAAADLSSIDEQKWYFIRSKWLLSDNVVDYRFGFVVGSRFKP